MTDLLKYIDNITRDNSTEMVSINTGIGANLSRLVFALRIRNGMTQSELADKLNVEATVISRIEGSDKSVTIGMYEETFLALGMTYEDMHSLINLDEVDYNDNR